MSSKQIVEIVLSFLYCVHIYMYVYAYAVKVCVCQCVFMYVLACEPPPLKKLTVLSMTLLNSAKEFGCI